MLSCASKKQQDNYPDIISLPNSVGNNSLDVNLNRWQESNDAIHEKVIKLKYPPYSGGSILAYQLKMKNNQIVFDEFYSYSGTKTGYTSFRILDNYLIATNNSLDKDKQFSSFVNLNSKERIDINLGNRLLDIQQRDENEFVAINWPDGTIWGGPSINIINVKDSVTTKKISDCRHCYTLKVDHLAVTDNQATLLYRDYNSTSKSYSEQLLGLYSIPTLDNKVVDVDIDIVASCRNNIIHRNLNAYTLSSFGIVNNVYSPRLNFILQEGLSVIDFDFDDSFFYAAISDSIKSHAIIKLPLDYLPSDTIKNIEKYSTSSEFISNIEIFENSLYTMGLDNNFSMIQVDTLGLNKKLCKLLGTSSCGNYLTFNYEATNSFHSYRLGQNDSVRRSDYKILFESKYKQGNATYVPIIFGSRSLLLCYYEDKLNLKEIKSSGLQIRIGTYGYYLETERKLLWNSQNLELNNHIGDINSALTKCVAHYFAKNKNLNLFGI